MGILGHFMGKSVYWSALSGHLYGCLQPFLIALCVCREDGTEPFREVTRKGEVELNKYKKTLIRETSNKGLLLFC